MFVCNSCGYGSGTKLGKCPQCHTFASFTTEVDNGTKKKKGGHTLHTGKTLNAGSQTEHTAKWHISHPEFKRICSAIIPGGLYLLAGAPGVGKSTIILQLMDQINEVTPLRIGYFSGEEHTDQVLQRVQRIMGESDNVSDSLFVYHSPHFEDIISTSKEQHFDCIVIDSIQTVYSTAQDASAGSPNQVKYCAEKLSEFCKQEQITCFVIGHITKGGEIAGPRYLEHIVDVVLYLEGDRSGELRFLRSYKNRFGHTHDTGMFAMTAKGLVPVRDREERVLAQAALDVPGTVLTIGLDNGRPMLMHIEVLLTRMSKKYPERNCVGISSKRIDLIVAVLQKYLGLKLELYDLYVHIPGELQISDSGIDLALARAIISAYMNKAVDSKCIYVGEIGLSGRISKPKLFEKRKNMIPDGFVCMDQEKVRTIKALGE